MALRLRTTRTTQPAVQPVTTAEAKAFAEYAESDRDDVFARLIKAAERRVYATGRQLITATFTGYGDAFPGTTGVIQLDRPPFQSVTSIKYYDTAGVQQTLDAAKYALDATADSGRIVVATWDNETWPSTQARSDAVEVIWKSGYGDAGSDVDAEAPHLNLAILQMVDIWFRREDITGEGAMSAHAMSLLKQTKGA